jgi:hypothetical protein
MDLELGLGLGDRIDVLRDLPKPVPTQLVPTKFWKLLLPCLPLASRIFRDQFVHHQSTCIPKELEKRRPGRHSNRRAGPSRSVMGLHCVCSGLAT